MKIEADITKVWAMKRESFFQQKDFLFHFIFRANDEIIYFHIQPDFFLLFWYMLERKRNNNASEKAMKSILWVLTFCST